MKPHLQLCFERCQNEVNIWPQTTLAALETLWQGQEEIWPSICSYYNKEEQNNPEYGIDQDIGSK